MPPDALQEPLTMEAAPEKTKLSLPSDFDHENHDRLGLTTLAETEFLLRTGQANDSLKHLREIGQIAKRRSETEIERADERVQKWAEVYRRAFKAMERLKPLGEDGNHGRGQFKELTKDDLIMLSSWMEEHRLWKEKGEVAEAEANKKGKGRRELPWIWKMQFGTTEPDRNSVSNVVDEWMTEAMRIEWLHANASVARFKEEMRLLEAESQRIGKTFRYYQKNWLVKELALMQETLKVIQEAEGGDAVSRSARGVMAYSRRQAAVFARLAALGEKHFGELKEEKLKMGI
ncbi:hypothetical protein M422DRAFT_243074 [Sphaerobolus stellatus SS14]|nr:hypothetical protein M422DRAFT_243074 [Sphaerobolus stellatus SS14]